MKKIYVLFGIIIIYIMYQFIVSPEYEKSEKEIEVTIDPFQENIKEKFEIKEVAGYQIIAKAKYKIEAVVVSKKNYNYGTESKFSPVDLALAWGELGKKDIRENIKFSQSNRWYFFEYKEFPLGTEYISSHSSNHHIVPANKNLRKVVKKIKKGDIVSLEGYLISIKGNNYEWNSSMTRNDTGNGACELLYVEKIITKNREYK